MYVTVCQHVPPKDAEKLESYMASYISNNLVRLRAVQPVFG